MTSEYAANVLEAMLITSHTSFSQLEEDALQMAIDALNRGSATRPVKKSIHDNILERDLEYDACGYCGFTLYPKPKYCPDCGRLIEWE